MQMASCPPESDGAAAPADAASSLTWDGLRIAAADERACPTPSLPKAAEMVWAELGANCRGTAQRISMPATLDDIRGCCSLPAESASWIQQRASWPPQRASLQAALKVPHPRQSPAIILPLPCAFWDPYGAGKAVHARCMLSRCILAESSLQTSGPSLISLCLTAPSISDA